MPKDHKQDLAGFVIGQALEPVLRARPDRRSEADRRMLERVQQATRAEIDRYRGYRSAAEVVANFKRDLTSNPAKKVHAELGHLGLPRLDDIRGRFEEKARVLGVEGA